MAVVTIKINGRDYQIACDDGQEDHLLALAEDIDERVSSLVFNMGNTLGEAMALLLTSLTLADEVAENQKEIDKLSAEVKRLKSLPADGASQADENRMAEMEAAMALTMEEIAARIEKIADQIEVG